MLAEAAINIGNVGLSFLSPTGPIEALKDVSATVGHGEFVALVGPSGCGKSTLLRAIAGLRSTTTGQIDVMGEKVVQPVRDVGMVFQSAVLLKWRTILSNVLLPAELAGLSTEPYRERALELLKLTGLEAFPSKRPHELSGGMQQRVALCRALLMDPSLLLMDEPFGALDAMTRDEMNLELLRVWGEQNAPKKRKTIMFVTHSIDEAVLMADRVMVMSPRPGRIALVQNIDLPRPRSIATRADPRFGQLSLSIYENLVTQIGQARKIQAAKLDLAS